MLTFVVDCDEDGLQLLSNNLGLKRAMVLLLAQAMLAMGYTGPLPGPGAWAGAAAGTTSSLQSEPSNFSTSGVPTLTLDPLRRSVGSSPAREAAATTTRSSPGGPEATAPSATAAASALSAEALAERTCSLRLAETVMHVIRVLACSGTCAQQIAVADTGLLRCLRVLAYQCVALSTQQSMPMDHAMLSTQAVAAGTLAKLCTFSSIRTLPVVREVLGPGPETLSALANLLLLPPSNPGPEKCYLAALLAAIASYGPFGRDTFTQVGRVWGFRVFWLRHTFNLWVGPAAGSCTCS